MKKLLLSLSILLGTSYLASAQLIPNAQFGLKAGVNLSSFSTNSTFSSDKRAGYLGGVYARIGGLGFNFQPELYVTGKNLTIKDGTNENKAKFTSLDVPLLLGTKVGAFGFGGRFYAGPLVSFNINEDQSLGQGLSDAVTFKDYKKQNFAAVVGAGVDIRDFSVDLRYEAGLTKQKYNDGNSSIRVSLFTLSVAYKLFSL
ncbi:hypothetical protein GCM10023149_06100 [Mucilaginibacter gynuensis]|uniref:Outer membrane protein beta-barrel domain-containing protein n=1 Tax=Mucilaginibacter gynuensis TaxID=1302236 RepID=A0ABP8FUB7_9SPHI